MIKYSTTYSVIKIASKLLLLVIISLSIGCESDKEDELVCDHYFLKEEEMVGGKILYFYNEDSLLAVSEHQTGDDVNRFHFKYDDDGLLTEVEETFGYKTFFFYEDGLLRSSESVDGLGGESNAFKYYYDEEKRLAKVEWYVPDHEEIFRYYTLKYPEPGIVEVQNYIRAKNWGDLAPGELHIYTIDNNPRPRPDEYYTLISTTGNVVLEHNQLTLKTVFNGEVGSFSDFSYEYNQGNYPLRTSYGITFRYSCEPPREP